MEVEVRRDTCRVEAEEEEDGFLTTISGNSMPTRKRHVHIKVFATVNAAALKD